MLSITQIEITGFEFFWIRFLVCDHWIQLENTGKITIKIKIDFSNVCLNKVILYQLSSYLFVKITNSLRVRVRVSRREQVCGPT